MYQDSNMLASIRKVEAAREENAKLDPRRMTAEEKETLLKEWFEFVDSINALLKGDE